MKPFTKRLRRAVHIPSSDRAIPPCDWILELDAQGVAFRRAGDRSRRWRLAWRSVIGMGLVHNAKEDPAPPAPAVVAPAPTRKRKRGAA